MILFSYYFYWFIKLLELTVVNKYTYTAHQTRLQARHQLLYLNMGNVSYIISFAVLLVWTIKKITNHRCLRGKHNKKNQHWNVYTICKQKPNKKSHFTMRYQILFTSINCFSHIEASVGYHALKNMEIL